MFLELVLLQTRMHSSRMRTANFSCHPGKVSMQGGVCLGVSAQVGCPLWGVSAKWCTPLLPIAC